ncbi:unnamed protein product [Orchesella dallaii]|uniref:Uncharacterized protein n=1 Tax=Orchesella dallaii TaxID=48710 RepID=A0ABP1S8A3_9HEXA
MYKFKIWKLKRLQSHFLLEIITVIKPKTNGTEDIWESGNIVFQIFFYNTTGANGSDDDRSFNNSTILLANEKLSKSNFPFNDVLECIQLFIIFLSIPFLFRKCLTLYRAREPAAASSASDSSSSNISPTRNSRNTPPPKYQPPPSYNQCTV